MFTVDLLCSACTVQPLLMLQGMLIYLRQSRMFSNIIPRAVCNYSGRCTDKRLPPSPEPFPRSVFLHLSVLCTITLPTMLRNMASVFYSLFAIITVAFAATVPEADYDVIVVGGGPSGLSALSGLSRVVRKAAVFDSGEYRNAPTRHMHDVIANDGMSYIAIIKWYLHTN